MISEFVKFLRGNVRICIRGPYLERFLNICAANMVELSDIRRTEVDVLWATVPAGQLRQARAAAEKARCALEVKRRRGVPFVLRRGAKRYGLILGAAVFFLTVYAASAYVWYIDIDAPPEISRREIRLNLAELGVYEGAKIRDIHPKDVQLQMMMKMEDVAFFSVNLSGNRADVQVIARRETPRMEQEELVTDIISDKTGVITKMDVKGGTGLKKVGETVERGEKLVDALVYPLNEEVPPFLTHSMADIEARTWYRFKRVRPLNGWTKAYTGETKQRYALLWGKKRINLFPGSRIETGCCDKIEEKIQFTVFGETFTPFSLVKQTYTYYELVPSRQEAADMEEGIRRGAAAHLQGRIQGTITQLTGSVQEEGENAAAYYRAECLERIGVQVLDGDREPAKEETAE